MGLGNITRCQTLVNKSLQGNFILNKKIDTKNLYYVVLASIISGIGLFMNAKSVVLGSMLISPLSVPIFRSVIGIIKSDGKSITNNVIFLCLMCIIAYITGITMALVNSKLEYFSVPTKEMEDRVSMPKYIGNILIPILAGMVMSVANYYDDYVVLAGIGLVIAFLPPIVNAGLYHGVFLFDNMNKMYGQVNKNVNLDEIQNDNLNNKSDTKDQGTMETNVEDKNIINLSKNENITKPSGLIQKGLMSLLLAVVNMTGVFITALITLWLLCRC